VYGCARFSISGRAAPIAIVEETTVFRPQLGAIALIAAFALPLAASAQTAPGQVAPAAAAAPAVQPNRHHRRPDRFVRALARLNLTPGEKRQITALLTPDQQAKLQAALARHRPAQ
jgi:Spy/CpxP family protein refolding chaperone